jgi:hypothetical protein
LAYHGIVENKRTRDVTDERRNMIMVFFHVEKVASLTKYLLATKAEKMVSNWSFSACFEAATMLFIKEDVSASAHFSEIDFPT